MMRHPAGWVEIKPTRNAPGFSELFKERSSLSVLDVPNKQIAKRLTDNDQSHQVSAPAAVLAKLTVNVTCIDPFAYRIGRTRGFFRAGYTAPPERSGAGLEWA
jgi:hypothetical protein